VEALPENYTPADIAEKVGRDIEHWYGIDVNVCEIARFSGLQHTIHKQGAIISWEVE